ncbi:MAG: hypothetical protein WCI57_02660 [Candidatus Berkelbacteria bacterium]
MQKTIIVCGPSGVGKGTIIKKVLENTELNLSLSKSITTRPQRLGDDLEGRYIFVSEEVFMIMVNSSDIVEWNEYQGYHYGTSRSEIEIIHSLGLHAIKDVDVNGHRNLRNKLENILSIFIAAPISEIEKRLHQRGANTLPEIRARLQIAESEMLCSREFNFVVQNREDRLIDAIKEVTRIIRENT